MDMNTAQKYLGLVMLTEAFIASLIFVGAFLKIVIWDNSLKEILKKRLTP